MLQKNNIINITIITISLIILLLLILTLPDRTPNQHTIHKNKINTDFNQNSANISPFQERSLQAGLVSLHTQGGEHLSGINETLGAGSCAFDFNNDDRLDIFTVGGSGQTRYFGRQEWWQKERGNALFENIGNGQFRNVTQQSGLAEKFWGMGCTTADLDNDGDQDLLLTNIGRNVVYRNNGNGTFTDITSTSGIDGQEWSTTATIADYDNDGLLDIYIVNYIDYNKGARVQEKDSGFRSQKTTTFNPALYNSQANRLYHNEGNLTFTDVTDKAGVANISGRGLSALWLYINNDFNIDLLVANDIGLPNALYINNGNGKFTEESRYYNLNTTQSTHAISSGDIDNDGDIDLIMSSDNTSPLLAYIKGNHPSHSLDNQSSDANTFNDLARDIGFGDEQYTSMNGWGLSLQDFNNDGWLDLLAVNGYTIIDSDNHHIPQGQTKQIWINQGNGTFRACEHDCGQMLHDVLSGRGIAAADFDNDGDIDSYISHNNDMGQLIFNQTTGKNWLNVSLQGTKSNRDAISTRVTITTQNGTQTRIVNNNPSFLSSGDKRLHFGLDSETQVKNMNIFWPNGDQQSFSNFKANRFLQIVQGSDKLREINQPLIQKTTPSRLRYTSLKQKLLSINWLYTSDSNTAEHELSFLRHNHDETIRSQVINFAHQHQSPTSLSILIDALDDDNEENRIASVEALKEYESEISVRWLLRSFNDTSTQVKCATANTFSFFFREEEAVIKHKYLAIPYLIRMLLDNDAFVRSCAARALGDSENYRASIPLTRLLNDSNDDVRAEAARSLGLIREKIATPYLLKTLNGSEQSGNVKLHSIAALQRLAYPDILKLLQSLLNTADNKNSKQLNTLLHALSLLVTDHEVGITFRPKKISELVYQWKTSNLDNPKQKYSAQTYIHLLEIFTNTKNTDAITFAKKMLSSTDEEVRANAYKLLILLTKKENKKYALQALKDKSNLVVHTAYKTLLESSLILPISAITPLHNIPNIHRLQIKLLIQYNNNKGIQYLANTAANSKKDTILRKYILDDLITSNNKNSLALPVSIYQDSDSEIRNAALRHWQQQNKDTTFIKHMPDHLNIALDDTDINVRISAVQALTQRKESWAVLRRNTILSDKNIASTLRKALLESLANENTLGTADKLMKIAQDANDPIRLTALNKLSVYPSDDSRKILYNVLEDNTESMKTRFTATRALIKIGSNNIKTLLLKK